MFSRVVLLFFLFLGCSVKQAPVDVMDKRVNELGVLIVGLSPEVNEQEARNLARNSIHYSFQLAKKYKAVSFPWFQNTLVNIGLKERGLCHEWAEDLLRYLVGKDYKTLTFHTVGANIGYLNEHNALSVSLKGEGIENSILLDAWRNTGDLCFQRIREDKEYEWKERKGLYGLLPPEGGK